MTLQTFGAAIRDRLTEQLLARRVDRWITGTLAALLVVLGFLAGRWTALTNRATPIVFQEAPGQASSDASPEELRALAAESRESGSGSRVAGKTTEKTSTPQVTREPEARPVPRSPEGGVGATKPDLSPEARRAKWEARSAGAFVASAKGEKYYHPDCPEVRRIKEENLVWFETEEEARSSGYDPSACVEKRR